MDPKQIERINELAHLAKERELTPEERAERAQLRSEYIESFRRSTREALEQTVIEYPDGTRRKLERKPRPKN